MRETIARVLRSYGLSRGGAAEGGHFAAETPNAPIVIDAEHHPQSWDHEEWQRLEGSGVCGVVLNTIPDGTVSLSPETDRAPLCRAVIEPPPAPDPRSLQGLHQQGVRGVRFRLRDDTDAAAMLCYADSLVLPGWHVELELPPGGTNALSRAEWILTRMPVPLCFTGLAGFLSLGAAAGSDIALLLEFVHMGRFWLKLSGAELAAASEPAREAVSALAHEAMATRPDRLVWGSGSGSAGDTRSQLADALRTVRQWFPDQGEQQRILISNPVTLYGF